MVGAARAADGPPLNARPPASLKMFNHLSNKILYYQVFAPHDATNTWISKLSL